MFGLFERREWKPETLTEVRGSFHQLAVTVHNVPCLFDAMSGRRKYAYSEFGNDFLKGLHEQLGNFDLLCAKLRAGISAHAYVKVSFYPLIQVDLVGTPDGSRRQFDSDLADTLIEAFKSVGLRPY